MVAVRWGRRDAGSGALEEYRHLAPLGPESDVINPQAQRALDAMRAARRASPVIRSGKPTAAPPGVAEQGKVPVVAQRATQLLALAFQGGQVTVVACSLRGSDRPAYVLAVTDHAEGEERALAIPLARLIIDDAELADVEPPPELTIPSGDQD